MPRFKIQIDENDPVIAGPEGSEAFNITVHDGYSHEEVDLPKLVAMTFESSEDHGSVMKHWLEETLEPGARIQIDVLNDGEIDSPSRVDSEEQPLEMCWYCFKTGDEVGYLVRAPKGTMHICDSCVDICADEIRKRKDKDDANT